jgi:hypothetical protein
MESYIEEEAMKTVTLTPDQLAMGAQVGEERWARGDRMPHSMRRLPEGTLMLMRVENMHGPNRRWRREFIAAVRIPRPEEICMHCSAPLSGGFAAHLTFHRSDSFNQWEVSMLCHTCAALPDEELLAAHARRCADS